MQTIKEHNLISEGKTLTVAISGGADSVALLHVLNSLKSHLKFSIDAVHINHCLRGDESERDQQFTESFCEDLAIKLMVFRVDITAALADTKIGIEEGARKIRYELLKKHAGENGLIATAHNLNDLAETLIFNVARGSSIKGISSIPVKRDNIIRPLIQVSRDEILCYLKQNKLEYVTDSTNLTDDYTRNYIRHNIIPSLLNINPSFLKAVSRLTKSAKEISSYLEAEALSLIQQDITASKLAKLETALINEYINLSCKEVGIYCERTHIDKARQVIITGKGACQLFNNFELRVKNDKVVINKVDKLKDPFCVKFHLGEIVTPYRRYKTYVVDNCSEEKLKNQRKVNNLLFKNTLDYDKINETAVFCSRFEGSRIKLNGRGCTKTLKKLFNEQKIPLWQRNELALLCCNNEVLWLEDFGVSDCAKVSNNTKRILIIQPVDVGDDYYKES